MKLFIGLDVWLEKTVVCAISEDGQIVREAEIGSEPEALACCMNELEDNIPAIRPDAVLMETRQVAGALKAIQKELLVYYISAGTDRGIVNLSPLKEFERFSALESRPEKYDSSDGVVVWTVADTRQGRL